MSLPHKFQIGQLVYFNTSRRHVALPPGVYEVMRPLPLRDDELEYLVKSGGDLRERVARWGFVKESDLSPMMDEGNSG
jgi:hypothetical protein